MKELTIGRTPDNDIQISDSSVSRSHASLFISGSEYSIKDHQSANGTYINGLRVNGVAKLKNTDIVKLGNALLPWKNYIGVLDDTRTEISTPKSSGDGVSQFQGSGSEPIPNASGALVCGIIGLILSPWGIFGVIGLVLSIIAVALGASGTGKFNSSPYQYSAGSYRTANAGKILGIIGISLFALMVIIIAIGIATGEIR